MKVYAENKKARHDFEFLEELEAGIVLSGCEVKSIKSGLANIKGAFALVRGAESYMVNAEITPFQPNNPYCKFEKDRPRKLLLHKKEIAKLADTESKKGLTVLVTMLYNNKGKIKAKVVIARHKKKHDKREEIKKKDTERELRRSLKSKISQ